MAEQDDDRLANEDQATRDLVRRAYTEAEPPAFDVAAGLRRLQDRDSPVATRGARLADWSAARVIAEADTLIAMSFDGGFRMPPEDGASVLFGRSVSDVHVRLGVDDPRVSRIQGEIVRRPDGWWLWNHGRTPLEIDKGAWVFTGEKWGPLPTGATEVVVAGLGGRRHPLGLQIVAKGAERREVEPDLATSPPPNWPLHDKERLVLAVVSQQYLMHESFSRPLSWRQAADQLTMVDPNGQWTARRVAHVIDVVRNRLAKAGVGGLTREEVGEGDAILLTHNLILELMGSTTLTPTDLKPLFEQPA